MGNWQQKLVHLDHCRGASWHTIATILQDDPELDWLYQRKINYWQSILHHAATTIHDFITDLEDATLKTSYSNYQENGIIVITARDRYYPARLTEIYQPPWVLYCMGNVELLDDTNMLAVIGTRTPSSYGIAATKQIVPEISQKHVPIVSGLARGIDSIAQKCALEKEGKVVAVIAGGFQHIYPKENTNLAQEIATKGLLLSEYPPIMEPKKWHFPMRNRIISGLSRGIFVVEGKKRSGTFITVMQGLDQGKDIFALPGNIFSSCSEGPNALIDDGAKLVRNSMDILQEWGL